MVRHRIKLISARNKMVRGLIKSERDRIKSVCDRIKLMRLSFNDQKSLDPGHKLQ